MDPVGRQNGKFPKSKNVMKDKLDEVDSWEANAPEDLGGGFNKNSGVRPSRHPRDWNEWQGKIKGKTKHTYGVNGENDDD